MTEKHSFTKVRRRQRRCEDTAIDWEGAQCTEYSLDNAGNRWQKLVKDPRGTLVRQFKRTMDALGRVQQATGKNLRDQSQEATTMREQGA